jgi:hypothetical protein
MRCVVLTFKTKTTHLLHYCVRELCNIFLGVISWWSSIRDLLTQPVRERLQNIVVFIGSHIFDECSPGGALNLCELSGRFAYFYLLRL